MFEISMSVEISRSRFYENIDGNIVIKGSFGKNYENCYN